MGAGAPFVFASARENRGIRVALFANALLGVPGILLFVAVETSRNGDESIFRRIFSATRCSNFAAFSTRQGPFFAPRRTVTDNHQARFGRLQGDLPHTREPEGSP